ncbi:hypothetical protein UT300003_18640 [Clostridium sardiniense]|uniref:DUF2628 domain-containing protein n=1 Tax=Clostridium sardiniense TaxID=29369 RepID=UPI00195C401D|nr:DUF2628 domain-containing protein [Clostridium sardiniense]MBM7833004.1 hypothetical protein [Clostridium sardiniense]
MFCEKCGSELGTDGKCNNPSCESNKEYIHLDESKARESKSSNVFDSSYNDFNKDHGNNSYYQNCYNNRINDDDITSDEFVSFIGVKNTEYYLEKLEMYRDNEKFSSWNWAAFFLMVYWLLYRKMYKIAAILFAINLGVSFFLGSFAPITFLIIRIGVGVYANKIYIKDSLTKIKNIKRYSKNLSTDALYLRLNSNGGTNLVAPLALFGVTAFIVILTGLFFISLIGAFFFGV